MDKSVEMKGIESVMIVSSVNDENVHKLTRFRCLFNMKMSIENDLIGMIKIYRKRRENCAVMIELSRWTQ